jgi:hypothetical protein
MVEEGRGEIIKEGGEDCEDEEDEVILQGIVQRSIERKSNVIMLRRKKSLKYRRVKK